MDTKLTLKLNTTHLEKAKAYASKRSISLSSLVDRYFAFLADLEAAPEVEISPIVQKLSGVLKLEADFDLKAEKAERLLEKYQ